ncbi:MAG: hypothetical protein KatS3mg010_1086 [Acidimicrobiia bacterium]|nr:MAG: hypothetical protein KatS3mg010_1086 [Acidimicrobiia bacterium]
MPGLIRGVARTAVIAGTATAVSNRVSRRQGERWAAQEQAEGVRTAAVRTAAVRTASSTHRHPNPCTAAPAALAGEDRIEALQKLGELRAQGVLTEAEFEAEKARILSS